jgi:hypothetical protein
MDLKIMLMKPGEIKEEKRSYYVIKRIKRISGLIEEHEYWNFVAGTAVVTLSVIGVLCYFFV